MTGLDLGNGDECGAGINCVGFTDEASQESHAVDFDIDLKGEEGFWVVVEAEAVVAGAWFQGCRGDFVLEDADVAGFVVADFGDAVVGVIWVAKVTEGGGGEGFDALLVEGIDDPFGAEEVLEEEVVGTGGAGGCCWDDSGVVGWDGGGLAGVCCEEGGFAGDGVGVELGGSGFGEG